MTVKFQISTWKRRPRKGVHPRVASGKRHLVGIGSMRYMHNKIRVPGPCGLAGDADRATIHVRLVRWELRAR